MTDPDYKYLYGRSSVVIARLRCQLRQMGDKVARLQDEAQVLREGRLCPDCGFKHKDGEHGAN